MLIVVKPLKTLENRSKNQLSGPAWYSCTVRAAAAVGWGAVGSRSSSLGEQQRAAESTQQTGAVGKWSGFISTSFFVVRSRRSKNHCERSGESIVSVAFLSVKNMRSLAIILLSTIACAGAFSLNAAFGGTTLRAYKNRFCMVQSKSSIISLP